MMQSKHIIIFIAVLALGLLIEGLKSVSGLSADKTEAISALSYKNLDSKPYYVSQSDISADRENALTHGGRARTGMKLTSSVDLKNHLAVATAKTDEKSTDEKAKINAKKKKKKKKSDLAKDKLKKYDDMAKKYAEREKDRVIESKSKSQEFVQQFFPAEKKSDELPLTYEDWARLILGSPRPDNVSKLIEYYGNNMVSADVFYGILAAMLEERNSEQHTLAVYAAGNVPSGASFGFLIQVLKTQSQGSTASVKANEHLSSYQTLSSVGHLRAVLTTQQNDVSTVQMAIGILDKSTRQYLENRSPSAEEEPLTEAAATKSAAAAARLRNQMTHAYAGFEPILLQIIELYSNQSDITAPAQKALTRIRNLTVVVADLNG